MFARAPVSHRLSIGRGVWVALLVGLQLTLSHALAIAQEPSAPQALIRDQFEAAIGKLGDLDYATRTAASRTIRRTPGDQAVPLLLHVVAEHADGYVRYRALVLLTGFNDPRTRNAMVDALSSPNDRLRTVAYSFFEHNPDPRLTTRLLAALETEVAEFVRPALVRALTALAEGVAAVRPVLVREAGRGEDFFRSAVIEALGDYKAVYAVDFLLAIAEHDGPLLDDATMALGKIGDPRARPALDELLRSGPSTVRPTVIAAICIMGPECASQEGDLVGAIRLAEQNGGLQDARRRAAYGLGAIGAAGRSSAVDALFGVGLGSYGPTRAPVSLALATVALRNSPVILAVLEAHAHQAEAIELLAEGFDMLEEDLEKERFFAMVRRAYWAASEASSRRELMGTLIGRLEF